MEHARLIKEFEEATSRLLEWIPISIARLNERASIDTIDGCRAKFEEYNQYKTVEYPPKLEEKGNLEAHYRLVFMCACRLIWCAFFDFLLVTMHSAHVLTSVILMHAL